MKDLLRAIQSERPEMRAHLLGQFILRRLTKSGISPGGAAEALGVSRSTFYDYLSGRISAPPGHRLEKLAELLELPKGTFELFRSGLGSSALGAALGSAVLGSALLGTELVSAGIGSALGPDGTFSGPGSDSDVALAVVEKPAMKKWKWYVWELAEAKKWLKDNLDEPKTEVETLPNFFAFRQFPPGGEDFRMRWAGQELQPKPFEGVGRPVLIGIFASGSRKGDAQSYRFYHGRGDLKAQAATLSADPLGAEELGALTARKRRGEPATVLGEHDDDETKRAEADVMLPVDPITGEEPEEEEEEENPINAGERPAIIAGEIEGHAVVWDELATKDATLFRAGAFTATLAESQARLLYWEHAHSMLGKGGSVPIGATFLLQEDPIGVFMRAWIADTALGRDVVTLMSLIEMAGLEMGASVAGFPELWRPNFVEPARAWERGVDEGPGALLSFSLTEVSLAGFPAIRSARVRLASNEPMAMLAAATERLARITGG